MKIVCPNIREVDPIAEIPCIVKMPKDYFMENTYFLETYIAPKDVKSKEYFNKKCPNLAKVETNNLWEVSFNNLFNCGDHLTSEKQAYYYDETLFGYKCRIYGGACNTLRIAERIDGPYYNGIGEFKLRDDLPAVVYKYRNIEFVDGFLAAFITEGDKEYVKFTAHIRIRTSKEIELLHKIFSGKAPYEICTLDYEKLVK